MTARARRQPDGLNTGERLSICGNFAISSTGAWRPKVEGGRAASKTAGPAARGMLPRCSKPVSRTLTIALSRAAGAWRELPSEQHQAQPREFAAASPDHSQQGR